MARLERYLGIGTSEVEHVLATSVCHKTSHDDESSDGGSIG
jgi:hypothetical protein